MNRIAGVALTTASLFLLVVAVMLNSPALFYMSTAMIALLAASRLQAWYAVRGLRFERYLPEVASLGEQVTVVLVAWSQHKVRRPLIQVIDHLPARMAAAGRTPALPIAPAYGLPIQTQFGFRPMRRGIYRWNKLTVIGTDALGLIAVTREYEADHVQLTVLPVAVPISFELPSSAGWGFAETEHGKSRGVGIQPRGIRDYVPGDALRFVHWPSTAKRGQLSVKDFEVGSYSGMALIFQLTRGSEVGVGTHTTLELMCGHAAYLIGWYMKQGVDVSLPGQDDHIEGILPHEREHALLKVLAQIQAESKETLGQQIGRIGKTLEPGGAVVIFVAVTEDDLPDAVSGLVQRGHPVTTVLYDANAFVPKRKRLSGASATDTDFINRLYVAGATIQVAPVEEAQA